MQNTVHFERVTLATRLSGMLRVDLMRATRSRLFYLMLACACLIPILMIVMTGMMAGTETVDPTTGEVTVMEAIFTNVWQSLGTLPGADSGAAGGGMELSSMCNINMMFMAVAIFVCLFTTDDFRCGYAKHLFSVRERRGEYVISKTLVGSLCGALMLLAYLVGTVLAGRFMGLPFDLGGLSGGNVVACLLSKMLLMPVFVSVFVTVSVAARQRGWLALCGSLMAGMLFFMMVPLVTPLSATVWHVLLCLLGGVLFAVTLGSVSRLILNRSDLV